MLSDFPTHEEVEREATVPCRWCGKIYTEHEFDRPGRAVPKMPCLGLRQHFLAAEPKSLPEPWKQEGPLDAGEWAVNRSRLAGEIYVYVAQHAGQSAEVTVRTSQHLRDFARALNRAADALEGKE